MTTKPRTRKFRLRRDKVADTPQAPQARSAPPQAASSGMAPDTATGAQRSSAAQASSAVSEIESIRQEGLTGRQLRMARRVAVKHGLSPASDLDAVRLLRQKGIDPFQRSNMLELVVPQGQGDAKAPEGQEVAQLGKMQLPQAYERQPEKLPSTELSPAQRREREISAMQRDLARRRRLRMALLMVRLAFFVFLPTAIVGSYYYTMATPMYATKSEFLIIQNEGSGGGGIGGLLAGTQFATSQDAIAVQGYLTSKDAMLRLDSDVGFRDHFQQDFIDPIQRISEDATNEEAFSTFQDMVKIGFDPTEGVIRMEVIAADPAVSEAFSRSLISYAEERVNDLSAQKRDDQMDDARIGFENAEAERRAAQERLVRLQLESSTLDPEAVIASLRAQINQVETLILEKELQLQALLDNTRPNQARVDGVQGDLRRLREQLDGLNERMTDASAGQNSLAQLTVNVQMAQADLATRDMMLQSALQQMEQARVEANKQVRYLTVSVNPVAPQEPTYPRAFENTILAFLVFAGIYLMISLTASILREQVSS